jgi:hypothetical protein
MNLPFAGGVVGVGDPDSRRRITSTRRTNQRLRVYAQDTWRERPPHDQLRTRLEL